MFKLNEKGLSLIEVIVAMAISSIVSLAVMEINNSSIKTSNKATSDFALQSFQQMALTLPLSDPANCAANFLGLDASANIASSSFLTADTIVNTSGALFTTVAPNNKTADGIWQIDEMYIDPFIANVSANIGLCNLKVKVTRLKTAFGPKDKIITVPLTCTLDGSNLITACSAGGSSDSNIWTLQFDTDGYEFAQYLPSGAQPGYVLIGPDMNPAEENDAGLSINIDGASWLGEASTYKGIRLRTDNFVVWDEWGIGEGLDADDLGASPENCFKASGWNGAGVTNYVQVCRSETRIRNSLRTYGDQIVYDSTGGSNHVSIGEFGRTQDDNTAFGTIGGFVSFNFFRKLNDGAASQLNYNRFESSGTGFDGGGLFTHDKATGEFRFYTLADGATTLTDATLSTVEPVLVSGLSQFSLYPGVADAAVRNYEFGPNNIADDISSLAIGDNNIADATYSTAIGKSNVADGIYSTAIGLGNLASGSYSTSLGNGSVAAGTRSFAQGYQSQALNINSVAMGYKAVADGNYSVALGNVVNVTGGASLGFGTNTDVSSSYSVGMGQNLDVDKAQTYIFGHGNDNTSIKPSSWNNNLLFAIGGGTTSTSAAYNCYPYRRNLMQLYDSGLMTLEANGLKDGNSDNTISGSCASTTEGYDFARPSRLVLDPPRAQDQSDWENSAAIISTNLYRGCAGGITKCKFFKHTSASDQYGYAAIIMSDTSGTTWGNGGQGQILFALNNKVPARTEPRTVYQEVSQSSMITDQDVALGIDATAVNYYKPIVMNGRNINMHAALDSDGGETGGGWIEMAGGTIRSAGAVHYTSDRRLKKSFEKLDENQELNKILKLEPTSYVYKSDEENIKRYGFIAQEVKEIYPSIVSKADGEKGYLSMSYIDLVSPIISAVKSLYNKIVELFDRTDSLELRMLEMEKRLNSLESENKTLKARLEVKSQEN